MVYNPKSKLILANLTISPVYSFSCFTISFTLLKPCMNVFCRDSQVFKNILMLVINTIGIISAQVVVQSSSCIWLVVTPWAAVHQAPLSLTISQSLLKLMFIESVMPSNHFILCHPLLLPSIFPSIRIFSSESALHIRWPKCWKFSFSINPSNEYSGLISFRLDWFDLLAVQRTLKSLL